MAFETKVTSPAHDGAVASQDHGNNGNHNSDVEKAPSYNDGSDTNKPDMEPQIGVGGRGHTQRQLKNYHITLIGFCSGIGTGLFSAQGRHTPRLARAASSSRISLSAACCGV